MVEVGWDTSSLVVLTDSGGNGIICESCCSSLPNDPGPYGCSGCTDYKYIQLTFTGISFVNGCCNKAFGSCEASGVTDANGVYTLEQTSSCTWRYTGSASGTIKTWSSTNCTGTPSSYSYDTNRITVWVSGSSVSVTGEFLSGINSYQYFSLAGATRDSGCVTITGQSSSLIYVCDVAGVCYPKPGYGGTVSIVEPSP